MIAAVYLEKNVLTLKKNDSLTPLKIIEKMEISMPFYALEFTNVPNDSCCN